VNASIDLEYDILTPPTEAERYKAWQADRRDKCLTGTEVPAILGLSPFLKPIDVWLDKKGLRTFTPNAAMLAGKRFEHAILEETASRAGRPLTFADPYNLIRVPEFPLLGATLDARWQDTGCPVDAKNIRYRDEDWGEDGTGDFPLYYRLQLHIQMMATGTQSADLAVCFTGQDFYHYTIGRDREIDTLVMEESERWWKKHIDGDTPPLPDGSESYTSYLKSRFARSTDVLIEPDDNARRIAENLRETKVRIAAMEEIRETFEQQLKAIIGDAACIKGVASWKNNRPS
jgi:putative phage-type endonuclease